MAKRNKKSENNDELLSKLDQQVDLMNQILGHQNEYIKKQRESSSEQEKFNKSITKTGKLFNSLKDNALDFGKKLNLVEYLAESDKALKKINQTLGTSGYLADVYKQNMMSVATDVASLGVSLKDLSDIQTNFVEETGKLSPLNEIALKRTSAISQAIGLGASDSGKLVANFNTIGFSAEKTADFVENTLTSSERMGVSGSKVVKSIVSNFDKLNKYNFRGGVESFKSMVQFSEKTRQNLEGVFNAAEKFRTIEGAIEATAELQTLGGAMAQADGFQLGFLARNDPEKFAQELNKMTQGIYNFDKASGQFKASAVDLDRLRRLAEITGQDFNELSKEARKTAEMKFVSSKMFGLSKDDKELVSQLASFDESSKKFTVKIDGKELDISKLTSDQVTQLKAQQKTLEERAKASQSFDEQFQNTITELKTNVLPLLNGINTALKWLNSTTDSLMGSDSSLAKTLTKLAVMAGAGFGIKKAFEFGFDKLKGFQFGKTATKVGGSGVGDSIGGLGDNLNKIPDGGALASRGKGLLSIGAGIALIGAGIGVAAAGIGYMADNFSKLNPEQLDAVVKTLIIMGTTMGVLGVVGSLAGTGLLAAGAGFLMIGGAIGIAAAGIGYMVSQFNELSNPDLGKNVLSLASGVAALAGSSALFANPLSIVGLAGFTTAMNSLDNVGNIKPLTDFLLAPKDNLVELRETINLLKGADLKGLDELKSLLKELNSKPLQVEFKEKDVKLNVNTTLMLDRDVLVKNLQIGKTATIEVVNFRRGT